MSLHDRPEPRIVEREAMLVAGARYEGKNEHGDEIPALWEKEFFPRLGELGPVRPGVFYGVSRGLPGAAPGVFEYLAAVEVRSLDNLPPGMEGWEIPGGTYAVLPAEGVAGIRPVMDDFYHRWLGDSPYRLSANMTMIEEYPETFPDDPTIYLLFSVERR
jgi:predicted transcriptional regulator YdeE